MGTHGRRPPRQQDRRYWDRMARRWDDEIFNSLRHDRFGVIRQEIERSSRGARAVADFGCGTGIYLPLLGRLFTDVQGFERSRACVAVARARVRSKASILVRHAAAAASAKRRGHFDVVLCVNVAVHPTVRGRASVLRAVRALLAPGGRLLLVVPSLESASMVATAECEALRRRAARGSGDWDAGSHADGVVTIEGMPYKHFSGDELRATLAGLGLAVRRIRRVEYSWRSQDVRPGPRFRGTLPWDWIAVAES